MNNDFRDSRAELCHSLGKPRRHMAAVQRQVGVTGSFHPAAILAVLVKTSELSSPVERARSLFSYTYARGTPPATDREGGGKKDALLGLDVPDSGDYSRDFRAAAGSRPLYQMPSSFHQAKPMADQIARFAKEAISPTVHQRFIGT